MSLGLLISCTKSQKDTSQDSQTIQSQKDKPAAPSEMTEVQEVAFDALNALQKMSGGGHLYSTFPDMDHNCSSPDSSFVISSGDFEHALIQLLSTYGADSISERRNELVSAAVLAQEVYSVEQCFGTSMQLVDGVIEAVPTSAGMWILPQVLGRRDVILDC